MNGAYANGSSHSLGSMDDRVVRTLPYLFRVTLPIPVTLASGI
jgi:hypothetical protein